MEFLDSCNLGYTNTEWLTLDDVSVLPLFSEMGGPNSKRISIGSQITKSHFLSSPFIKFGNVEVVQSAYNHNGLGVLVPQENQSFEDYTKRLQQLVETAPTFGFLISTKEEDLAIIEFVLSIAPSPIVVIRSPYGETQSVIEQIARVNKKYGVRVNIVAGDFVNPATVMQAIQAGCSSVIVGTNELQSTFVPDFSIINSCRKVIFALKKNVYLFANPTNPSKKNVATAFGAGSDAVIIQSDSVQSDYDYTLKELLFLTNSTNLIDLYDNARFIKLSTVGVSHARIK